jgi:hypothetical protein
MFSRNAKPTPFGDGGTGIMVRLMAAASGRHSGMEVYSVENPTIESIRRTGHPIRKWHEVFAFIRSNPGVVLWRSVRRFVYMWTGYWSFRREYLREEPFDPANIVFCTGLTALAMAGLRRSFRAAPEKTTLYALVLLVFPLVYYFTIPERGYRQSLEPVIVILASYAVVSWVSARQNRRSRLSFPELDVQESLMPETEATP